MFTKEQIEEISQKLAALGIKDSQFDSAKELTGDELIPLLQDGNNRLLHIDDLNLYFNQEFLDKLSELTESLNAETTRATEAEETLSTSLETEITRATEAEQTLTDDLAAEVTRAIDAEAALQDAIDSIEHTSVELADGTTHITLEAEVDDDSGATTYIIGESDIASAAALNALTDRVSALEEIVEKLQEEVEELLNPTIVSTSYSTPTVTLSYDGVSASGGTVSPIISYSQIITYTWSNGTTTSETITSGATTTYSLTSGSSYASINSSSGAVTVNANTGLSSRTVGISVSVTLNSKTGTNTATIIQAAGSSYITISPASITIGTEGGTEAVIVSSNDSWTVE